MKKQNFTGLFLIVFLVAGALAGLATIPQVRQAVKELSLSGWMNGTNQKKLETTYDDSVVHRDSSVSAWGRAGYVMFGEGRKGVLIGTDGWLFSTEEFARADGFQEAITQNLAAIKTVKDKLAVSKAVLFVVPVPSKARIYREQLGRYDFPAHWQAQYEKFIDTMDKNDIAHADLLPVFEKAKEARSLYLRTDTHWTPDGARRAAQAVAAGISSAFPYLTLEPQVFRAVPGAEEIHEGDLMRYVAVGNNAESYGLVPDTIRRFTADTTEKADLFGDAVPSVVLIGTSYSADERWGFELFLKEALQTDILNRADEGQGPFTVMDDYLASNLFKTNPPRLVIWEIPERYLPVVP